MIVLLLLFEIEWIGDVLVELIGCGEVDWLLVGVCVFDFMCIIVGLVVGCMLVLYGV